MTPLCLTQLRLRLLVEGRPLDGATEAALKGDARPGARAILDAVARRRFENRSEGQRLRKMLRYETALWETGIVPVTDSLARSRRRLWPGRWASPLSRKSMPSTLASRLAMRRAVAGLSVTPQQVLVDVRRVKDLDIPQQPIAKSLTIAAASILAKTARDAVMQRLDAQHPGYGFAKHKGYPVPEHLAALQRLGASPSPPDRA